MCWNWKVRRRFEAHLWCRARCSLIAHSLTSRAFWCAPETVKHYPHQIVNRRLCSQMRPCSNTYNHVDRRPEIGLLDKNDQVEEICICSRSAVNHAFMHGTYHHHVRHTMYITCTAYSNSTVALSQRCRKSSLLLLFDKTSKGG